MRFAPFSRFVDCYALRDERRPYSLSAWRSHFGAHDEVSPQNMAAGRLRMSTQEDALPKAIRVNQQVASNWALAAVVGLLGVVGYLFTTIQHNNEESAKSNAVVQANVAAINVSMTELQKQIAQTYRADDARRDMAETTRRIEAVERRVGTIETIVAPKTQPQALQQWRKN